MESQKFSGKTIVKDTLEIGNVIRLKRKETHLTQARVAAMCNVGLRFISDLENGKKTVEIGKALKVINVLGLRLILQKRTLNNE